MTITHAPQTVAPCPSWCRLPAGHRFESEDPDGTGLRFHEAVLDTWEHGERTVGVTVEALTKCPAGGTEAVGTPAICLNVTPTDGLDDLTAEEARTLSAFLKVTLDRAADAVDKITEAQR